MAKKETCSKCGKSNYSVATDRSNKYYCQTKGCGNVWVPGLEGLKRTDVVLKQAQEENRKLKEELSASRKENEELKAKLKAQDKTAEAEIFS